MQIIHVHAILCRSKANFVRCTVCNAALDPGARHPGCKAMWIVIATGLFSRLSDWKSPKFPSPDDQRVIQ